MFQVSLFFFFQAEDGIRDDLVTGVQTCALPICHPHIVTIYEVGHARPSLNVQPIAGARTPRGLEVHYIAMEYIDGRTLREAVEGDSLPLRRCIELLTEVADGLTKAHAAGIIHRDLKPDN